MSGGVASTWRLGHAIPIRRPPQSDAASMVDGVNEMLRHDQEVICKLKSTVVELGVKDIPGVVPLLEPSDALLAPSCALAASRRLYPARDRSQNRFLKDLPKQPTLLPHWEGRLAAESRIPWRTLVVESDSVRPARAP